MALDFSIKYDLSTIDNPQLLEQITTQKVKSYRKIGEGFYGAVYLAEFVGDCEPVIVKWAKFGGMAENERAQLELLGKHSLLRVPDVYRVVREEGYELLMMEYIPGVDASRVVEQDETVKGRFRERVIDNLLALHSVKRKEGFGPAVCENGNESWSASYHPQVEAIYRSLQRPDVRAKISSYVWAVVEKSLELLDSGLLKTEAAPALVHGDYNLWNILVDPVTYEAIGLIDPMYCCWGDSELDLFQLNNGGGDQLGLLEAYRSRVETNELLPLKSAFYHLWDDLKHYINMGWYQESHFVTLVDRLKEKLAAHSPRDLAT